MNPDYEFKICACMTSISIGKMSKAAVFSVPELFQMRPRGLLFSFFRFFFPLSCGLLFLFSKYILLQDSIPLVPIDKVQPLHKVLDSFMLLEQVRAQSLFSDIRTTN